MDKKRKALVGMLIAIAAFAIGGFLVDAYLTARAAKAVALKNVEVWIGPDHMISYERQRSTVNPFVAFLHSGSSVVETYVPMERKCTDPENEKLWEKVAQEGDPSVAAGFNRIQAGMDSDGVISSNGSSPGGNGGYRSANSVWAQHYAYPLVSLRDHEVKVVADVYTSKGFAGRRSCNFEAVSSRSRARMMFEDESPIVGPFL